MGLPKPRYTVRHLILTMLSACCVYWSLLSVSDHLNSDFLRYAAWFNALIPFQWNTCDGFEPIFCSLGLLYRTAGMPFGALAFSTSVAIYAVLLLLVWRIVNQAPFIGATPMAMIAMGIMIYVFFPPQMVSHLIRQYLALIFLLLAIASPGRGGALLALIAIGFHFTAAVFLPLIILKYLKISRIQLLMIGFLVIVFALIFSSSLYSFADEFASSNMVFVKSGGAIYDIFYKIRFYFDDGGISAAWWKLVIISISFSYVALRSNHAYSTALIFCFLMVFVFMVLSISTSSIIFERFYQYGKGFSFLVLMILFSDCLRPRKFSNSVALNSKGG